MNGTAGALRFLALRSARNRAARMVGRLRNPRYVVALIAGLLYFGWIFTGQFRRAGDAEGGARGITSLPPWAQGIAPLPLLVLAILWWTTGRYHTALAFSPPEVHFLFSAPLTRRRLVIYKLFKRQLRVVLTVLLSTLYLWAMSGGSVTGGRLLRSAATLWVLVSTLHLHQIGASLARAAAAEQGRAGIRKQGPAFLLFAAVVGVVLVTLARIAPAVLAASDIEGALSVVQTALAQPAPRAALLPLRLLLAPLFASSSLAWLRALPGAFLVLGLHAVWVVRSDAAFEEGAAEAGRAQAERRRARLQGRRTTVEVSTARSLPRPWFGLAPTGHPAVAIFWKNITMATRQIRPATGVLLGGAFAVAYFMVRKSTGDPREAAATCMAMSFVIAGLMLVMGPLSIRNDLRADLRKLDVLRTYPLAGKHVVAAEVASSALVLTALQLVFVLMGIGFLSYAFPAIEPPWLPVAAIGGALLLLPPVNTLLIGAQNTLAVLFPAWTHLGADAPGGIERTGMFALTMLGTVLFLALALLPAAAFGLGVGARLLGTMGAWTVLPSAIAAWLVLWGEIALVVVLLGEEYDQLDPVEAGLLE